MTPTEWITTAGVAVAFFALITGLFARVDAKIRRVHDRIDSVRKDLHRDHESLRNEMREGFDRVTDRIDTVVARNSRIDKEK